jgi:hypothetical protein
MKAETFNFLLMIKFTEHIMIFIAELVVNDIFIGVPWTKNSKTGSE